MAATLQYHGQQHHYNGRERRQPRTLEERHDKRNVAYEEQRHNENVE